MPGSNAGTGQPIHFRCSACRRRRGSEGDTGWRGGVTLTGKRRETGRGNHPRIDSVARQYVCQGCGHVGWSKHRDLLHLERYLNETNKENSECPDTK